MTLLGDSRSRHLAHFAFAALLSVPAIGQAQTPAIGGKPNQVRLAQLPLHFVENRGQSPQQVRFQASGKGYGLFLTPTEAVFMLQKPAPTQALTSGSALRLRLLGANAHPQIVGQSPLPGKVNYLRGNDPQRWQTNLPTYAQVRYANVYKDIDLVYYGNQNQLEYDFRLAAQADPSRIGLEFAGAQRVAVDASGNLRVGLGTGEVRWHRPVAYQEVSGKRVSVASRYVVSGHRVGFVVAKYDTSKPLIIDPVLNYSTFLGGTGTDSAAGVALDSADNVYITGSTTSNNFPTTMGAFDTSYGGGGQTDAFVAKLNPSGTALVYSTYIGGSNVDNGLGIAVDSAGSAYVTGYTISSDFPTTATGYKTTAPGNGDAFLTKLSPDGTSLAYSTYIGGTGLDSGTAVAVDNAGHAYVTGYAASGFPTSTGAAQTTNAGGRKDAFVVELDTTASGTASRIYSTYVGGGGADIAYAIAIDSAGNAYITGNTLSNNFPNSGTRAYGGGTGGDAFVTKLNSTGTARLYSVYLGGSGDDSGAGIAVDAAGNAYVTGSTTSPSTGAALGRFPISAGAVQAAYGGSGDAFVTVLDSTGLLAYSTYLGGSAADAGTAITLSKSGNVFVAGVTSSTGGGGAGSFPTSAYPFQSANRGGKDSFLCKFSLDGTQLLYATLFGGSGDDTVAGLAVTTTNDAVIVGATSSSGTGAGAFPTTAGALQTSNSGSRAFASKFRLYARYDFNDDGKFDLVLQSHSTGRTIVWNMDYLTRLGATNLLASLNPDYKIVAVGDFNGDGENDLLLQSETSGALVLWYFAGGKRLGTAVLRTGLPPGLKVVAAGDMNGDGKLDLILQNTTTAAVSCWTLDGTTIVDRVSIYPSPFTDPARIATTWRVVGTGDFDGDGHTDLILYNPNGGAIACWYMQGTRLVRGKYIRTTTSSDWALVAVGDVDGDGKPDLIFRHKTSGAILYWKMEGINLVNAHVVVGALDLDYQLVSGH